MDLLTDDIVMGESPRWHDGRLYVSDWGAGAIVAVVAGRARPRSPRPCRRCRSASTSCPTGGCSSSPADRRCWSAPRSGRCEPYAELGDAGAARNDIVVDGRGNAYVDALGFDFGRAPSSRRACVALVRPDGGVVRSPRTSPSRTGWR